MSCFPDFVDLSFCVPFSLTGLSCNHIKIPIRHDINVIFLCDLLLQPACVILELLYCLFFPYFFVFPFCFCITGGSFVFTNSIRFILGSLSDCSMNKSLAARENDTDLLSSIHMAAPKYHVIQGTRNTPHDLCMLETHM